ncbi:tail tube intiator [Pectobacterium phage PP101]|uniref:Tail tube intiator n=1 Tax=Pectobacterium phage PP101 TaxID=1916414 RepID=A0A1J0MF28_9CAUD|nr:tail protein [Pectobacterium phage PP101]APD19724.1 tail tube intiator [Pectobacterium phage PP101]
MSMIDTITDFAGNVGGKVASKFHYGHHPSIIMWSNGEAVQKEEPSLLGQITGGVAKALEDITMTGGVPESFSSFKFDAMVSEGHSATSQVTSFPVSSGFVVSDHVILQNRILKLNAVASNMQNSAMWAASIQGLSVITGAIFNSPIIPIVGGIAGAVASAFETEDRITSTYNLFRNFQATGKKLYVSTILGPYLNCIVTKLECKHDKDTSAILSIEITLEELQVIGKDEFAEQAKKAMESMYDYSEFAKIATSLGVGVLGGVSLPGLGSAKATPTEQMKELQAKLDALQTPASSVKGVI